VDGELRVGSQRKGRFVMAGFIPAMTKYAVRQLEALKRPTAISTSKKKNDFKLS
jgi:hypothetical protein